MPDPFVDGLAAKAQQSDQSGKLNGVDDRPMPEWGRAPNGDFVPISDDARLPGLFTNWLSDACRHPETLVLERKDSLGRPFFSQYCTDCGKQTRNHLPRDHVLPVNKDRSADDMQRRNRLYCEARQEALDRITSPAAERCQSDRTESYSDYLRSDDWKRRRAKILHRAGGICEGCLTRPATEVHHLTYDHIGNEFAFELVAICEPCHRRYHPEKGRAA